MLGNVAVNRRLLVLTSATGAGHDTHAHATEAWCRKIYGAAVEVRIAHVLEESHAFNRAGVEFYNFIQRHGPWFHHVYYNAIELLEMLNHGTVTFGKSHYVRLLEDFRPDAILSVHDCLNLGYAEVAREVIGPGVRFATYCVEFGGGYGFSRNWINPRADMFFARTDDAAAAAGRRMEHRKIRVAGHWAPPDFYLPEPGPEAKAETLTEIGLQPGLFTVLLSTGGAGAQNHVRILNGLVPLLGRLQTVVLCGRNAAARDEVDAWAARNGTQSVRTLGFTRQMPALLHAASVVVTRAGATTAGEALLCGCPTIFNALGGIMPQELPTWRYFRDRGVGRLAYRPETIARVLHGWLKNPADFQAFRMRFRTVGLRHAASPEATLPALVGT